MPDRPLRTVPARPGDPPMPPACYGLEWADLGVDRFVDGTVIRHAEAPSTARYRAVLGQLPTLVDLEDLGLGYRHDDDGVRVLATYAGMGAPPSAATMDDIEVRAAECAEMHRSTVAEAAALRRGRDDEIRAALKNALRSSWWSMSAGDLQAGRALVDGWRPDRSTMMSALGIVERSRASVLKVADRVRAQGRAVADAGLCEDPDVRYCVLAACRVLSFLDDDRATEANRAGWSQATSRPGHWLAGHDALSPRLAAIGMRLVRRHRRQLPQDLRAALGIAA